MLRERFGSTRDEVTVEWRKVHNEDIVRGIKSRRMRWAGHVARMGENRGVYGFMGMNPEGKKNLKTQA